jgi:hypothetical protein
MKIIIKYQDGTQDTFERCGPLGGNEAGMYVVMGLNKQVYGMFNPIHVKAVLFPDADNVITVPSINLA